MYKVNIQNSMITIGETPFRKPDWVIDYYNNFPFDKIITQLENSPLELYYHIRANNAEHEAWKEFSECFKIIYAAGGIVKDQDGKILIIKRHGKFDLPKGKVEEFENLKEAALREVYEECGISTCVLVSDQPIITYHTYTIDAHRVLKKTHWFLMTTNHEPGKLIPQTEEGITEVFWVDPSELKTIFTNTYPNIRDLLQQVS